MAHPDDAEMCAGGTLAVLARAGAQVSIVVCSLPDHPDLRVAEAEAGAKLLGAEVRFLAPASSSRTWQVTDYKPYDLVAKLDALAAQLQPEMIFTHWSGDAHDDHVAVARSATTLVRKRAADLYACEQPNQYTPVAPGMRLNTYVDISSTNETKIAALNEHVSQTRGRHWQSHLQTRTRFHGERLGWQHAEAFECVFQTLGSARPGAA
jgi:N-acetylglucosamine malate deacetylase 1